MRIHQMGSCLSPGDAITNHILEMDKIFRRNGYESKIFSNILDGNFERAVKDYRYKSFINNENDILLFHYSVYCDNVKLYKRSKNKKIFIYHNITPEKFYKNYNNDCYYICKKGRSALAELRNCDFGIGDSEYNRLELVENGFDSARTDVLPIFLHLENYNKCSLNERLLRRYGKGDVNILFVGRIATNKKCEDVIKVFYYYNKLINPKSRLFLIGSRFLEKYDDELLNLMDKLGVKERVVFPGKVSLSDLRTYYTLADVFLLMSEHEGFCVPLIESMYFKVPVIAYNAAAVPYTLGKSGILVNKKKHNEIAEMIDILVSDTGFRQKIIQGQLEQFDKNFGREKVEMKLCEIINKVI